MSSKQWEGPKEECWLPHISSAQSAQEEDRGEGWRLCKELTPWPVGIVLR